jgi:choline dehydrogenase-like flavoprotein
VNCGICSGYGCQVRARSSSAVTMIPLAEKTGRCEIRVRRYVREISTDSSGRVTGVIYFNAQKQEIRQKAKAVILSANGSEPAPSAVVEIGTLPRWSRELEWGRWEVSDGR